MNKVESLESLVAVLPIIQAAVLADMSIVLCDREKFIVYYPGKNINLGITIGNKISPEEPLMAAMVEDKFFVDDVPAEHYGFEFTGTALPIHTGKIPARTAQYYREQLSEFTKGRGVFLTEPAGYQLNDGEPVYQAIIVKKKTKV